MNPEDEARMERIIGKFVEASENTYLEWLTFQYLVVVDIYKQTGNQDYYNAAIALGDRYQKEVDRVTPRKPCPETPPELLPERKRRHKRGKGNMRPYFEDEGPDDLP